MIHNLPANVCFNILSYCEAKDFNTLKHVCKKTNNFFRNNNYKELIDSLFFKKLVQNDPSLDLYLHREFGSSPEYNRLIELLANKTIAQYKGSDEILATLVIKSKEYFKLKNNIKKENYKECIVTRKYVRLGDVVIGAHRDMFFIIRSLGSIKTYNIKTNKFSTLPADIPIYKVTNYALNNKNNLFYATTNSIIFSWNLINEKRRLYHSVGGVVAFVVDDEFVYLGDFNHKISVLDIELKNKLNEYQLDLFFHHSHFNLRKYNNYIISLSFDRLIFLEFNNNQFKYMCKIDLAFLSIPIIINKTITVPTIFKKCVMFNIKDIKDVKKNIIHSQCRTAKYQLTDKSYLSDNYLYLFTEKIHNNIQKSRISVFDIKNINNENIPIDNRIKFLRNLTEEESKITQIYKGYYLFLGKQMTIRNYGIEEK